MQSQCNFLKTNLLLQKTMVLKFSQIYFSNERRTLIVTTWKVCKRAWWLTFQNYISHHSVKVFRWFSFWVSKRLEWILLQCQSWLNAKQNIYLCVVHSKFKENLSCYPLPKLYHFYFLCLGDLKLNLNFSEHNSKSLFFYYFFQYKMHFLHSQGTKIFSIESFKTFNYNNH